MNSLRRLAAFIPVTLSRRILRHGAMDAGVPNELHAATLFSDISGFTAMSEELATDGARGAEEVNRVLMLTFTAMIDVIHAMGGAVAHFHGDAMAIYFPDEDGTATARALSCAQQMQALMLTRFQAVETHRPPDKEPLFPLTIKIGAGYGRCQELVLGDEQMGFEFVLMGTAVEEAAEAEKHASAGQIIASRSFCEQLKLDTDFTDFTDIKEKDQCLSVESVSNKIEPLLDWAMYDEEAMARLEQIAPAFVPPSLHQRLHGTGAIYLAEHRPVTSIFVGFEYDDGQMQAYYQHVHAIVQRFGAENGRLNRVLTGDKGNQLHIMFGAPIAPDAPDQAIRCALALQRERPAYISEQRIGLAAGKVFAGPVGASSRSEYTVVGDVVNLSARLTAICENGRVLTDESTAHRVRQSIEFSTVAPVYLKGKQGAMVPHYALGDVATATQIQAYFGRWNKPLVGRDEETAVMLSVMDEAWNGDSRLLSIVGVTGAGKTRLLAAGVHHWLRKGGEGLVGVCQQHLSDTPFAAWSTIWQDFFGLLPTMDADEQAQIVTARTRALLPDVSDDDVGLWGELLGLPIEQTAVLTAMTAESRQMRFFALARRCLQMAATTQPLLIVLEDIHWADQASLKLIDELAARLMDSSLLIVMLFRPVNNLQLDALADATTITITDLTPQNGRQLMQQLTGEETLPPLVEQHLGLRDRDGRDSPVNPLFLEESLNMLMAAGVLQINGRVQVDETALANMPLPDSIYGLLLARLDRLEPARRELLQIASVIGREFALKALDGITREQDRNTLIQLLSGLSSVQMTQLIADDPEWIYLFQHALTHEVAYESLPFARRQILHTAVADWLETQYADNLKPYYAALAYHYGHTNQHEKGLKYALAAANAARDIFANKEAVEFYTMAERHLNVLGVEELWETAVDIYLSFSNVLRLQSDFVKAKTYAHKSVELTKKYQHQQRLAQAYNMMADISFRQAQYDKVLTYSGNVIHNLSQRISSNDLALAYLWTGWAYNMLLDHKKALQHFNYAKQLCVEADNNPLLARIYEAIGYSFFSKKDLPAALTAMQQNVTLSRQFSSPVNIGMALNNVAFVQFNLGKAEDSRKTFLDAVELGRDTSLNLLALALMNYAMVSSYLGDYATASDSFQETAVLLKNSDDDYLLIEVNLLLGYEFYSALRMWGDAKEKLDKAIELINLQPESYPEEKARSLIALGQIELEIGSLAIAEALFKEADEILSANELKWWHPALDYFHGVAKVRQQKYQDAQFLFNRGMKWIVMGDGCPDYLPLLLSGSAQITENVLQKHKFLKKSAEAALNRSRFAEKLICMEMAGYQLHFSTNPQDQTDGKGFLLYAKGLREELKLQNLPINYSHES